MSIDVVGMSVETTSSIVEEATSLRSTNDIGRREASEYNAIGWRTIEDVLNTLCLRHSDCQS